MSVDLIQLIVRTPVPSDAYADGISRGEWGPYGVGRPGDRCMEYPPTQ